MKIAKTVDEVRQAWAEAKARGQSVGLVPTMGALHDGHASLIRAARRENDFAAISIFVNPTQFAPTEDLAAYPRDLESDARLAGELGVDLIFAPDPAEMYRPGAPAWVEVEGRLTSILCARSRPTHFRGVTTVVNKLLNIVRPDRVYFGQKDGQQAQIVRRMIEDLFIPTEIRILPIIRESDGLALSSRNAYLDSDQRRAALALSRTLHQAKEMIEAGETRSEVIARKLAGDIRAEPLAELDYAEIHSFPDLAEVGEELPPRVFLALAVKFGRARLIDNVVAERRTE